MPQPARRTPLEERIASYIHKEGLRPGDRLPSERKLAGLLGVSRASLRTAMSALAMAGIVYVKHGSGTYVAGQTLGRMLDASVTAGPLGIDPLHVVEARHVLEPPMFAMSARKATPEDLELMHQALEIMSLDMQVLGTFTMDHDQQFHQAVIKGAHNILLENACRYLYTLQRDTAWTNARNELLKDPAIAAEFLKDHYDMYDAISRRQPRRVEALMERHSQRMMDLMAAADLA